MRFSMPCMRRADTHGSRQPKNRRILETRRPNGNWSLRKVRAERDLLAAALRPLRRDSLRLYSASFEKGAKACQPKLACRRAKAGSSGWIRTNNPPVNLTD